MKLIKIKPRLVDHSLIRPSVSSTLPAPKPVTPKPTLTKSEPIRLSFWFNLIGVLILCIGGLILHNRYVRKEQIMEEKQHSIVGFTQYVKEVKDAMGLDKDKDIGKYKEIDKDIGKDIDKDIGKDIDKEK